MRASWVVNCQSTVPCRRLRCRCHASISRRSSSKFFLAAQPTVQALAAEQAEFDLRDVEPTAVLGRVMDLQFLHQPPRFLRGKGLVQGRQLAQHRGDRSEEHTSELQSRGHLVCRLLLEKKK